MLAILMTALASTIPTYVGCSERARFRLLGPTEGEIAPTNTRIWLLEYVSTPEESRPALLDDGGNAVAFVETTTPLRNGLLLVLEPEEPLSPLRRYTLQIADRAFAFETGAGPDLVRPEVPAIEVSDRAGPLDHCLRSGSHHLEATTNEGGLFFVASTAEDGDVALSRDPSLSIPASEGESIEIAVASMDLAGNRSPTTLPFEVSAGCTSLGRPDLAAFALWTLFFASCRMRLRADRRRASSR